jgi:hypothetical protein
MKVNGNNLCSAWIETTYEHGSCAAVVHLTKGDRVWMEPWAGLNRFYVSETTAFAGFLFYADPA